MDSEVSPIYRFRAYPFATDTEYQAGIAGILNSGALEKKSEEEKRDIVLRSEVFYFNRVTGLSITIEEAKVTVANTPSSDVTADAANPPAAASEEEPQTLSFAQLKELIEQGRTDEIPNNKHIPNVLSAESPSESKAQVRKKPWETSTTA